MTTVSPSAPVRRRAAFSGLAAIALGVSFGAALPARAASAPPAVPAWEAFPVAAIGPAPDAAKKTVVVIDAGGTLTARARDRISYQHYQGNVDGGVKKILEDLYPELGAAANIRVMTAGGLGGSSGVTNAALYNVARAIDAQLARPDVDGVVVTTGTNVMEEDAYFFDLTVQSDKPVVVTGAMHQYGTFTYDAYTNLFSSIRLAASGKTTCFGAVVLLNDQFFAARDVTKTDGYRMDTFEVRHYGALGVVNEDHVRVMRGTPRVMQCGTEAWKRPFDLAKTSADKFARVDIAYGYIEASAATITGLVAAGAKGIVTAGHGPGNLSYLQQEAQKEAVKKGVVFVAATRTGGEGVSDAAAPGIIGGGDLLPQKARMLLQLGLTFSGDPEQVRAWFNTIGQAEFDLSGEHKPRSPAGP